MQAWMEEHMVDEPFIALITTISQRAAGWFYSAFKISRMRTWKMISLSLGFPCTTPFIKEKFINIDISLKTSDKKMIEISAQKMLRIISELIQLFHELMSETIFYLYFLCILHMLERGNDSTIQSKEIFPLFITLHLTCLLLI